MFCSANHIIINFFASLHVECARVWLVFDVDVFVQAAQASVAVGSQVWVEDPDVAWIDGEVVKVSGSTITVKCSNEKTVCLLFGKFGG
jgi:myosin-5